MAFICSDPRCLVCRKYDHRIAAKDKTLPDWVKAATFEKHKPPIHPIRRKLIEGGTE